MVQLIESGMIPTGSQLMENWNTSFRSAGLTWINMCKDRALTLPADGGIFVEAYTSTGGRQSSVVTAETDTLFVTNKYIPPSTLDEVGDTTANPNTFVNPDNAFDNNSATASTRGSLSGTFNVSLGKTFSVKNIATVRINVSTSFSGGSGGASHGLILESFDGSVWVSETGLGSGAQNVNLSYNSTYVLGKSVQGLRVRYSGNTVNTMSVTLRILSYGVPTAGEITHTIPAGTFPSDMSSSILTFDPAEFEEGASVEYKLTNATEDTGWLATNGVVSFTALTAEPDELIVRLTPKTVSPTAGYPSIRGICLQAGRTIE